MVVEVGLWRRGLGIGGGETGLRVKVLESFHGKERTDL